MKIYRVDFRDPSHVSIGYAFTASMKQAHRASSEFRRIHGLDHVAEIEHFDVDPTRDGILRALNTYASHATNG